MPFYFWNWLCFCCHPNWFCWDCVPRLNGEMTFPRILVEKPFDDTGDWMIRQVELCIGCNLKKSHLSIVDGWCWISICNSEKQKTNNIPKNPHKWLPYSKNMMPKKRSWKNPPWVSLKETFHWLTTNDLHMCQEPSSFEFPLPSSKSFNHLGNWGPSLEGLGSEIKSSSRMPWRKEGRQWSKFCSYWFCITPKKSNM